jgi:hypothetical protein
MIFPKLCDGMEFFVTCQKWLCIFCPQKPKAGCCHNLDMLNYIEIRSGFVCCPFSTLCFQENLLCFSSLHRRKGIAVHISGVHCRGHYLIC